MPKIAVGITALVVALVGVTAAGFALFSSTVTVSGLSISTGTPALEISVDEGVTWGTSLDASGLSFAPFAPGVQDWGEFWLRNNSNEAELDNTRPLDLDIEAQITAAFGDWVLLDDVMMMRICIYDETMADKCGAEQTDWHTFSAWNTGMIELPGNPLAEDAVQHYAINLMMDDAVELDNTYAGKSITDMVVQIVGTQVEEVE